MSYKKLKKEIKDILQEQKPDEFFDKLKDYNPDRVINPLIGLLYDSDDLIRFRAVEAIGFISSQRKDTDVEKLRVLMRRFIWNLNEESGGIGWGSPEAMAETAAASEKIYNEFIQIIISYIDPESGSFLDHEELHPGVVWGIGRLAKKYPDTAKHAEYMIKDLLKRKDSRVRGLAVWTAGNCRLKSLEKEIEALLNDSEEFILYDEHQLETMTIAKAAENALLLIKNS